MSRVYWERIEPVAESFGDLDPKIDGREDVIEEGMEFTGFHRLEKDLWVTGLQADSDKIADQLLVDVKEIVSQGEDRRADARCSSPTAPRNCSTRSPPARSPARRTATRTPTCGTSGPTWTVRRRRSPRCARWWSRRTPRWCPLWTRSSRRSTTLLEKHRKGDGFKLYTELTQDEIKALAEAVDALGEPVSKVAEVVCQVTGRPSPQAARAARAPGWRSRARVPRPVRWRRRSPEVEQPSSAARRGAVPRRASRPASSRPRRTTCTSSRST